MDNASVGLYVGPGKIRTFTGKSFDVFNPDPKLVDIEDIAHALSMLCRYAGHCKEFYSVAQHSVLVSYQVPKELAFLALLHDAHEAYTGDLTRPIKVMMPKETKEWWDRTVYNLDTTIGQAFGLAPGFYDHPEIKHADNVLLAAEAQKLVNCFNISDLPDPSECRCPELLTTAWYPNRAKYNFKLRFNELVGGAEA